MKRIWAFLAILVLIIIGGLIWWNNGISAKDPSNKTYLSFVIPKGEGVREIAHDLKQKGFIKDQVVFFLLTKKLGLDEQIQAGYYKISPSMKAEDIAKALTHGTLDIWVTIPEGYRAKEIAETLKAIPTYQDSWGEELEKHEGYLFPDTYLIPRQATIDQIVEILTKTFDARYATLPTSKSYNEEQIVTIASLVEREARHDEDRPIVASVITNRLNIGMKLDIDATLQYALGYQPQQKRWWKESLSAKDKQIDSPYNTYQNAGLPPTPISNPGIESLRAAINPANTPYFYYFTDKNGVNHYAKTLQEQESNIEKYGL